MRALLEDCKNKKTTTTKHQSKIKQFKRRRQSNTFSRIFFFFFLISLAHSFPAHPLLSLKPKGGKMLLEQQLLAETKESRRRLFLPSCLSSCGGQLSRRLPSPWLPRSCSEVSSCCSTPHFFFFFFFFFYPSLARLPFKSSM